MNSRYLGTTYLHLTLQAPAVVDKTIMILRPLSTNLYPAGRKLCLHNIAQTLWADLGPRQ